MKQEHELEELLRKCPIEGSWWRHYRGDLYVVIAKAVQEATLEPLVIYRGFGSNVTFARPLKEWHETVEKDNKMVRRFDWQSNSAQE